MINLSEVIETNSMIEKENLDVRTITLGISLLECMSDNLETTCRKVYDRITTVAKDLVRTGEEIERDYAIPIVNKRISITPAAIVGASCAKSPEDFVKIAQTLDRAAKETGVNFLGGFSALPVKGMTEAERNLMLSIPEALSATERVCSSVAVGSTKVGINMDAVLMMGEIIRKASELTASSDSSACAKLVVFCNAPDDNPFMAGAFHGVTEADSVINAAFKITRLGQLVAKEASERMGIPFGIVDLSLAPTPAIGDSISDILEGMGLERTGAPGTTLALTLLNDQVKKGGIMASSYVGGLSGAFIPVSEDQGMINAVNAGALSIEKLEAMTCICSVGLDMIAIPGNTSPSSISGIIADEMAIGMINQKTTAVRIIPVAGKDVGDTAYFGGLLGYAPVMAVSSFSCDAFVRRGGRIPAPVHSFRN